LAAREGPGSFFLREIGRMTVRLERTDHRMNRMKPESAQNPPAGPDFEYLFFLRTNLPEETPTHHD
jgi:hypothetical protein